MTFFCAYSVTFLSSVNLFRIARMSVFLYPETALALHGVRAWP